MILAENQRLSDARAYMDELFEALGSFLGDVVCLMLHETGITDGTCVSICHFFKGQFARAEVKGDERGKHIDSVHNVDAFKLELRQITARVRLRWKHKDEEVRGFMRRICDDYGLLHMHCGEETDGNVLAANNFVMSTEGVAELFQMKIEQAELDL